MSAYLIQIFIPAASESTYSGHNADDTFIFKLFQIQTFSDSVKIYICKHFDGSIIPLPQVISLERMGKPVNTKTDDFLQC